VNTISNFSCQDNKMTMVTISGLCRKQEMSQLHIKMP